MIRNFFKHFHLVNRHRFKVFILCCKAGIPIRGLLHDLSKYSYTEFSEGIKYYVGKYSPIAKCKTINGYSKAWLHHKGRNKHHYEYWYDNDTSNSTPMMPYKYVVEMICDNLAAGMTYNGKDWHNDTQLKYWEKKKDNALINENLKLLLLDVFTQISLNGINKTINTENLRVIYEKYNKNISIK